MTRARRSVFGLLAVAFFVAGCAGGDAADDDVPSLGAAVLAAVAAVEGERGAGQEYFEVTAAALVTNVFVAVDEATAAVPYAFIDGELLPPEPRLDAAGFTFSADAIEFDADAVLSQVADELPDATIESLSVEGGDGGIVRYVALVRSDVGGLLEVTVGADGAVLAVDPR